MTRRVFQLSVAVMLTVAVGGYWAVLQTVAWVGMTITYSQEDSIGEALKKTFDGQHPCKLCLAVKHGKQAEKKTQKLKVEVKLDLLCLKGLPYQPPNLPCKLLPFTDAYGCGRVEAPPLPPPRIA